MKPDIDRLFKDGHRKMDEAPSRMTWERVHQRLEHHRTRTRMKRVHMMSIAAVVLTIICFGAVSMLFLQHQNEYHRLASAAEYGAQLVELDHQYQHDNDMYQVANVKNLNQTLRQDNTRIN